MDLTYLGHSAFAIEGNDTTLLIDPWLTDNPHTSVSPETFDEVTAILVTHGADDHLGEAPRIAQAHDADLLCDSASASILTDRGFPSNILESHIWGPHIERDGWAVRIVQARHQSAFVDEGVIGPALAYIVTIDGCTIYHMGDTAIFSTLELYGDLYEPDITLIPVGGVASYYPELYPDEAALVAEWLESDIYVPMHYDVDSDRPAAFKQYCTEREIDGQVRIMAPEETLSR